MKPSGVALLVVTIGLYFLLRWIYHWQNISLKRKYYPFFSSGAVILFVLLLIWSFTDGMPMDHVIAVFAMVGLPTVVFVSAIAIGFTRWCEKCSRRILTFRWKERRKHCSKCRSSYESVQS